MVIRSRPSHVRVRGGAAPATTSPPRTRSGPRENSSRSSGSACRRRRYVDAWIRNTGSARPIAEHFRNVGHRPRHAKRMHAAGETQAEALPQELVHGLPPGAAPQGELRREVGADDRQRRRVEIVHASEMEHGPLGRDAEEPGDDRRRGHRPSDTMRGLLCSMPCSGSPEERTTRRAIAFPVVPTPGRLVHQPRALEKPQRLAQRRAADAELLAQRLLGGDRHAGAPSPRLEARLQHLRDLGVAGECRMTPEASHFVTMTIQCDNSPEPGACQRTPEPAMQR